MLSGLQYLEAQPMLRGLHMEARPMLRRLQHLEA